MINFLLQNDFFNLSTISSIPSNKIINSNKNFIQFLLSKKDLYKFLQSINYFQIFNIPLNYNIDKISLDKFYKELQFNFHPDKFKNNDAENCSAIISLAYKTLKDDISRMNYIIKLNKLNINSNNKKNKFLTKFFNIQEEIENNSKSVNKLNEIQNDTLKKIKEYKDQMKEEYDKKNFPKIQEIIDNINYSNSIINHINKIKGVI